MRYVFLFLAATAGSLSAGTISTLGADNTTPIIATDITGFATTGADMSGMTVTATFTGGVTSGCVWATTTATGGGCLSLLGSGTGFLIQETGDTFTSNWNLNIFGSTLLSLLFDGLPGFTVFDRTLPNTGTAGSESGADANGTTTQLVPSGDGLATYLNPVGTMGNAPVGDIYTRVRIDFAAGLQGSATWLMDTDNIGARGGSPGSQAVVPEPASMLLIGIGLVGGALLRRKQSVA